jgi:cytochrome P450
LGSEAHGTPPVLEFDPFADTFRGDPEGFYAPVREAGAVVFLERDGIWLLARFAEVRAALRDPERFCSATGSGSVELVRIRVR